LAWLSDVGQDVSGRWQYKLAMHLVETAGVEVTTTSIQIQALVGSNTLATVDSIPPVSVPANSISGAEFVFASDTYAKVSEVTVNVTIAFRDANGNTGAINSSFSCFGCWDY
jgi:hypothetical protein